MFVDCHAHIIHPFNHTTITQRDVDAVVSAARRKEVDYVASVSANPKYYSFYDIERHFGGLMRVVGIQRGLAQNDNSPLISNLRSEIELHRPKAIGEIGLDYNSLNQTSSQRGIFRRRQQQLFRDQIRLAREFDLPIVIHEAGADRDLLATLEEERADDIQGMVHGCTCGREARETLLDMGFFLSFGFSQLEGSRTSEMISETPVENLLTETDSPAWLRYPDMSVQYQPADVPEIAGKMAEIKEMEIEEFAQVVLRNAGKLFRF
ncbi:MAG: TatD family hydrolase [Candidatus Thorarchaeota archaeon]